MKKEVIVISLGGSLIVPDKIDPKYLLKFIETIRKNTSKYKFVIVCGGGVIARKYIATLKAEGKSRNQLALAGIRATRMNAQFVMQLFDKKEVNDTLPESMKSVKDNLAKNPIVICGALRFAPNSTTDGTAAKLANYLKSKTFINMTNVKGLYDKNPKTNKKAKFIPEISWTNLEKMALKIKYKPGQNFVIDQQAATIIKKNKIPTYIISGNTTNLNNFLKCKKFTGTTINN
jgi:uridylate kinase